MNLRAAIHDTLEVIRGDALMLYLVDRAQSVHGRTAPLRQIPEF